MLFIGKDRREKTHKVLGNARLKACGYRLALCGTECLPTEQGASDALVDCFYCNHAYDLGVHLLGVKNEAQEPAEAP